jgi:CBS domain-containing protein
VTAKIEQLMTAKPMTLSRAASCVDAARMMQLEQIGDVLVTENDGRVRGILTDRDIVVRVIADDLHPGRTRIGDICSPLTANLTADATVEDALEMMTEEQVRRLPVIDDTGRAVGILSLTDLAGEIDRDIAPVIEAVASASD